MSKFVLIQCDDWAGLYKDGELVEEGHSIPYANLCHHLGAAYSYDEGAVDDYLFDHGTFPKKMEDLPGAPTYD